MKNTILMLIVNLIAPHECVVCGKLGEALCRRCKRGLYQINPCRCLNCGQWLHNNCCNICALRGVRQLVIGRYEKLIKRLIITYKYDLR